MNLHNEIQFDTLKSKYSNEIKEFTEKIKNHPSLRQIGVMSDWEDLSDRFEKKMTFVEKAEMYHQNPGPTV